MTPLPLAAASPAMSATGTKTATLSSATPAPSRFVTRGTELVDLKTASPIFFKGIGYSPYLPNESPIYGVAPGDDARYEEHRGLIENMGVNYLHVFPLFMPSKFFSALDRTDMVYGQDIWIWAYDEDFLAESFLQKTMQDIKGVIDHVYSVGRPDRLMLFSIGDELRAESVIRTDTRHPDVRDYTGKHLSVSDRTPNTQYIFSGKAPIR